MASFKNYKCTPFKWHEVMDGIYQIDDKFQIQLEDDEYLYTVTIKPGFRTDGGSIPWLFSWFAKGWSDDYSYNACFILHDALYAAGVVHRSIADDMLRSALRDVGMDRLHASTICWCVNTFACSHYKDDDLDNLDFIEYHMHMK